MKHLPSKLPGGVTDVDENPAPAQYILNKSENATLQLSIFCEKVLDKKYLLKLNNVP